VKRPGPTRRDTLVSLAALACVARPARATLSPETRVGAALLDVGASATARPGAVEQLLWETSKRTSILVRERPAVLAPTSPSLFDWPLLVWIGVGEVPPLDAASVTQLGRWIRAGGLLFVDDASPLGGEAFDASVRRELARALPGRPLKPLSGEHTLFRSFYLLDRAYGRVARAPAIEGIDHGDRTAVVYSRNDLLGAFGRDPGGGWRLPVEPGGDAQREMALRLGINLTMYATCLDYKRDQVHVTEILRRRRWSVDGDGESR
jgi:hypothetical protein